MTDEIRHKANTLHKQIEDTQNKLNIILDMRDSGKVLTLHDSEVGSVHIQSDHVLKYDILDEVEHTLTKELYDLQEEYKKL
jgi:hypothetical protein